jgi:hypothetical protein
MSFQSTPPPQPNSRACPDEQFVYYQQDKGDRDPSPHHPERQPIAVHGFSPAAITKPSNIAKADLHPVQAAAYKVPTMLHSQNRIGTHNAPYRPAGICGSCEQGVGPQVMNFWAGKRY